MHKEMEKELRNLRILLKTAEEELEKCPEGRLRCTKNKGYDQYYIDGVYVRKDEMYKVKAIAKREYYENLIPLLIKAIHAYEEILDYLPGQKLDLVYDNLCEGRKHVLSALPYKTVKQIMADFEAEKYESYEEKYPIVTEIYTAKGEHVRSKSECMIADMLNQYGVLYKYETALDLEDGGRIVTLHPDFVCINKQTGKRFYIEHCGMMSNGEYSANNMKKIRLYEKNGILQGDSLIIFYETNEVPLSTQVVKQYIERYLL